MTKLGDICIFQSGGTPSRKNPDYFNGDIPWITTTALNGGNISFEDANEWISTDAIEKSAAKVVPAYSIMVGTRVGVGKVALNLVPMSTSQDIISLIDIDENKWNKEFLCKFIIYQAPYLNSQARGATIKGIKIETLAELELPECSIPEQRLISSVLDNVSKLITLRKEQLAKLDQLVKSRFIELFDGKGYPEITIGELVASKVNSVKKVLAPTDTIKYIDISSIDNKRNVMTGYTEYVLEEAPSRAQQHIKKGDIVVSTVRPNLKNVAITGYEYDNLVASSGFCVLRAEKCLPAYLMAVVCSNDFTDAMTKVVTGANYPAIKDSDVRNYVVPNPPIEIQEQFAAFVKQTDKSKLAIQQSLDKLELLKKSLMQEYFG